MDAQKSWGETYVFQTAERCKTWSHRPELNSSTARQWLGRWYQCLLYPCPPSPKVSDSKQNRPGHSLQPLVVRDTERTIPAQTKAKEVSQTIGRLLPLAMGLLSLGPLTWLRYCGGECLFFLFCTDKWQGDVTLSALTNDRYDSFCTDKWQGDVSLSALKNDRVMWQTTGK